MNKIIIIILLFSQITTANPVIYLDKGQEAPYSGYLFSPEKELEIRTKIIDCDRLGELTKTQSDLIQILNNRIEIKQKEINNLNSQNQLQNNVSSLEKWIYFGIGALLVGTMVKYVK